MKSLSMGFVVTTHLFWATPTFLCHLLHCLVGANMRPPLHMLPKAACPDLRAKYRVRSGEQISESRPVGSATPHSGDPSNSTAGTPGLGRCLRIKNKTTEAPNSANKTYLMSSRLRHTVGLALVLSNVVVHQGDNVRPEGGTCL